MRLPLEYELAIVMQWFDWLHYQFWLKQARHLESMASAALLKFPRLV
jgi:hypothetical protein